MAEPRNYNAPATAHRLEAALAATAHLPDCAFLRAATCSVAIECDHGYDVCPICDPCRCAERLASA